MATRMPYPSLEDLSPLKHGELFDPARKYRLNITKMSLHLPDEVWIAQLKLGRALVMHATIDARLREMVILRIGHLQDSGYELFHHRSIASHVGISDQEIAAIEGGDLGILSPRERALVDFATEIARDVSPGDASLAAMRAVFSDQIVFEVTAIIGYYMMIARFIAVSGIETDPAPVTTW